MILIGGIHSNSSQQGNADVIPTMIDIAFGNTAATKQVQQRKAWVRERLLRAKIAK